MLPFALLADEKSDIPILARRLSFSWSRFRFALPSEPFSGRYWGSWGSAWGSRALRRLREITKTSDDTTDTKHSFLNVSAMEERIKMLYLTHFSYEGTLAQIAKFMIGNSPILVPLPKTRCRSKHKGSRRVAVSESDLVCRPLPRRLLSEFVVNSADS